MRYAAAIRLEYSVEDPGARPDGRAHAPDARARLRAAVVAIGGSQGLDAATPEAVAHRAGLPRETFSEHYASVEDCVVETYEELAERIYEANARGLRRPGSWRDRLRAARRRTLELFRGQPGLARFAVLELPTAGFASLRERRVTGRDRLVDLLVSEHRRGVEGEGEVPRVWFELLVGASFQVTHRSLEEQPDDLAALDARLEQMLDQLDPAVTSTEKLGL